MDYFGNDIDTLIEDDENDEHNVNIRNENIDGDDEQDEAKQDGEAIKVEPKKRAVRNPQLRLNVERLKSNRGIHTLETYCADLKFRGKGHEREDLNNMMKRLEHWAHRLYPSYKFDDFVATVEKLGRKKELKTHMYRYRNGLLDDDQPKPNSEGANADDDDDAAMTVLRGDDPIDELDEIIDQQIQNYTTFAPRTPAHDRTFDSIRSSMIASPRLQQQFPMEASTPIVDRARPTETAAAPAPVPAPPKLSTEQMARIAENRRLAQERLKKKQEAAIEQQARAELPDVDDSMSLD